MRSSKRRGRRPPTRQEVRDALNLIPKIKEETTVPKTNPVNEGNPILVSRKPEFIKWDEVGQVAEGRFRDMRFVQLTDGACPRYTLKTSGDKLVAFLAPLQIAEALEGIPLNTYVRIEYLGKEGRMKDFAIETEEFETATAAKLVDGATGELFEGE